jgi:membrane fusion protein (multidrug efflux system)
MQPEGEPPPPEPSRRKDNGISAPPARETASPKDGVEADPELAKARKRKRLRIAAIGGLAVAVIGLGYYLYSRQFESTDDAQIDANISNIGARVPGTVMRVAFDENQHVRAGEALAEIDPTDLGVALAQAKASVAQAVAQLGAEDPSVSITETSNATAITNASANISSAQAALSGAERDADQASAHLEEAEANANNSDLELQRGRVMLKQGAIPRADFDHRQTAADAAQAVVKGARQAVEAARARVAQQKALMSGVRSTLQEVRINSPRQVDSRRATLAYRQANLDLAKAQERQAELNLGYATVRTPVTGIVARKSVNVGDNVAPGQGLAAITNTTESWVTANFRETQLRHMRPGQHATIHVDALDQDFRGSVESLGGATGSRVSLFPPENATGNYVKVVQRIPVRIRFDDGQDLDRLRPGMSVVPRVRVSE